MGSLTNLADGDNVGGRGGLLHPNRGQRLGEELYITDVLLGNPKSF